MDIVNEILQYIGTPNTAYWYVGIATTPRERLFSDHSVDEHSGRWIYRDCTTQEMARKIEKYLLDAHSFKGGPGGGDNPRFVYAYQITNSTIE